MKHMNLTLLGKVLLMTLGLPASVLAQQSFTEDFSTRQYCNNLATTAVWDTIAGSLHLPAFEIEVLGGWDSPGSGTGLAYEGGRVFLADNTGGLKILNVSDSGNPTLLGSFPSGNYANDVDVEGDFVYMADGSAGLRAVNITTPAAPTGGGVYNTPSIAYAVEVDGDWAYVADGASGLQVVNVRNPMSLTWVGSCDTPGNARDLDVEGGLVFVVDYTAGLAVIDISDPAAPVIVGGVDTPGWAYGVAVDGDYAYVADGLAGLCVIDVGDPNSPVIVATLDTPGTAWKVAVAGYFAYVADASGGVHAIDIRDPLAPVLFATCTTPGSPRDVVLAGTRAFVADYSAGLQVLQVATLVSPAIVGEVQETLQEANRCTVQGNLAFVADSNHGLQIIDITNPANPTLVGSYATPNAVLDVAVAGDLAFLANRSSGLQIIDITNPANPTLVCSYYTGGDARGVAVAGDLAFVADRYFGFRIVNISDPGNPWLVGSYNTPGNASKVTLAGNLAFVADSNYMLILDITIPYEPTLVKHYGPLSAYVADIAVAGDNAFVATYEDGLQIFDITNPASPISVGSYNTPGSAEGVSISGYHAYIADFLSGLQVIDITNPANPWLVGNCDTPGWASHVAVDGDHAFVADGPIGFQVVQVYSREVDVSRNIGQSVIVEGGSPEIRKVRLTATQVPGVDWEVTMDNGDHWQAIVADNTWNAFPFVGSELLWRSTLGTPLAPLPIVSDLHIEWLWDHAWIDAVTDIPEDQGGWVRLNFMRSARDFEDEATLPIANYGIWRRVDDMSTHALLLTVQSSARTAANLEDGFSGLPLTALGDRTFVQTGTSETMATGFPAGIWELVQNVPALQTDSYLTAVPTLGDSTSTEPTYTVLVVTAHTTTPSIWYVSEPDSACSVDNLAPAVPTGLILVGTQLSWDASTDADFDYFSIYGSESPELDPEAIIISYTVDTESTVDPAAHAYWHVTATDFAGNESEAGSTAAVSEVPGHGIPTRTALLGAFPNPFNPQTTIAFELSKQTAVNLHVFDVSGRLVRRLLDGETAAEGRNEFVWNGREDTGRQCASGTYFYRLDAGDYSETKRMVLIK